MYARRGYIPTSVRIKEKEDSNEFIHVRLEAIQPLKMIGVYLETNSNVDDADECRRCWRTMSKGAST